MTRVLMAQALLSVGERAPFERCSVPPLLVVKYSKGWSRGLAWSIGRVAVRDLRWACELWIILQVWWFGGERWVHFG